MYFVFLIVLHLFCFLNVIHSESTQPPKVAGSFYASGEIVTVEVNMPINAITFEESFDMETKQTAALFTGNRPSIRFNEDIRLNKTYAYVGGVGEVCLETTSEDWVRMSVEPHLKGFELMKGIIILPLRQLLLLEEKQLVDKQEDVDYRGIRAHMWIYQVSEDVNIEAYWSTGEWNSPSKYHAVPLGFKIIRKENVTYLNILNFQHDRIESALFEPIRGLYCPGRLAELYPFTKAVALNELEQFSYSMEVVLTASKSISSVDTWIDMKKKIIRTDYDPYGRESTADYHSFTEIVSFNQGATYEISPEVDTSCLVDEIKPNPDMQILFDYTDASRWTGAGFFGLDKTDYIFAGETEEQGIPCRAYHGMRTDFPYGSSGFTTLWEWCLSDHLKVGKEKSFPVVSLNIYFKEVNESAVTKPNVKLHKRLTYHFYNARHNFEITQLLSQVYDIQDCFHAVNKADRVLIVPVKDEDRIEIQRLVYEVNFVREWWAELMKYSELKKESLRLTNIRLRFAETGPLEVYFTLLERHQDLPNDVYQKEPSLTDVLAKVDQAVKNQDINVVHTYKDQTVILVAEKMELVAQLGTAKQRFLTPESNQVNNLSDPIAVGIQFSQEQKSKNSEDGWSLGIFLGVGGAMLVSGVGLGIFSGVSGIVLKRKYAPSTN